VLEGKVNGKILRVFNRVIRHQDMKAYGEKCIAPSFLTSTLDSGEWSASLPRCFTPGDIALVLTG
jgi:hypothetical protein